jgi:hypothetical protein
LTGRIPRRCPGSKNELERENIRSGKIPMIANHATAPVQRPASITPAGLSAVSRIPPCLDSPSIKVEAKTNSMWNDNAAHNGEYKGSMLEPRIPRSTREVGADPSSPAQQVS